MIGKSKLILIMVSLLVVVAVLFGACAQPAPTPTPTVKPTLTPTATPTAKAIREIMIPAGRIGAGEAGYPLGQGLSYYINRDSTWLRTTVVTTDGMSGDYELIMAQPDKYVGWVDSTSLNFGYTQPQFNKYQGARIIGGAWTVSVVWVTYDKNIKTLKDVAGKRVFVGRKGGSRSWEEPHMLQQSGMLDKVAKIDYGGFGGAVTALKDGLTDVAVMVIDHTFPATFAKGAYITDLEAKGPIYYVSIDPKAQLESISKKIPGTVLTEYGDLPFSIYAGALDDKTQKEVVWGAAIPCMIMADQKMSDDVAYEFARVLWERRGQFGKWHVRGEGLTDEFIPIYVYDISLMHPGAMKFYQEKGIKVRDLVTLLPS